MYRVHARVVCDDVNPGNENPQIERKTGTQEEILERPPNALQQLLSANFLLSEALEMSYGTKFPIGVQLLLAGFAQIVQVKDDSFHNFLLGGLHLVPPPISIRSFIG